MKRMPFWLTVTLVWSGLLLVFPWVLKAAEMYARWIASL